jgi:hypothetical protein
MLKGIIFRVLFVLLVVSVYSGAGCGSSNKGATILKKSQASKVNASQLGRNKYYFSKTYQSKLTKSYKKR